MHVAVTAVGADRPGIVAAVTSVLFDVGANIEDSRSATLGGHFAMMLIVSLPQTVAHEDLERRLGEHARAHDLLVSVRPVEETAADHIAGIDHVISVYGADHPGIVARVSGFLAERGVNIRDLATHVVPGDPPVYVMLLEVTVAQDTDPDALRSGLEGLASELSVEISLRPAEPETL